MKYFLEKAFELFNFEPDDIVLTDFDIFFNEHEKEYNRFVLDDDEDKSKLCRFIKVIRETDRNAQIYVCTYGQENIFNGKKTVYADQIWIDTIMTKARTESIMTQTDLPIPSDICVLSECNEIAYDKIYHIRRNSENKPVTDLLNKEKTGRFITLYWD